MDLPHEEIGVAPAASGDSVHANSRVRRPLSRTFWLVAIVVPIALTALVGLTDAPSIEKTLSRTGRAALRDQGITDVRLAMDGRRVTARVPTGRDPVAVAAVLSSLPGFAEVSTKAVFASAAEARACRTLPRALDRATNGQQIPFVGSSTQLDPSGRRLVDAVARLLRDCRPAVVTVGGHTDGSTYNGGDVSLQRARVVVAILKKAGIGSERLLARGYADQLPLDEGDGAVADARNQRVSVIVAGQ